MLNFPISVRVAEKIDDDTAFFLFQNLQFGSEGLDTSKFQFSVVDNNQRKIDKMTKGMIGISSSDLAISFPTNQLQGLVYPLTFTVNYPKSLDAEKFCVAVADDQNSLQCVSNDPQPLKAQQIHSQNKISTTATSHPSKKKDGLTWWVWLLIAIGGVFLLIVVIIVFVSLSKKTSKRRLQNK